MVPLVANRSTITQTSDLLGRVVSYRDVFDNVTTPNHESLTGRVRSVSTTPAGDVASVHAFAYDTDGKVATVKFDGTLIADPVYETTRLLQSVACESAWV